MFPGGVGLLNIYLSISTSPVLCPQRTPSYYAGLYRIVAINIENGETISASMIF